MRHVAVVALVFLSTSTAAAPLEPRRTPEILSLLEGQVVSIRPYESFSNDVGRGYVLVLESRAEGYGDCRSQHLKVFEKVAPGGSVRSGPWLFERLELTNRYRRIRQYRGVASHPCPSPLVSG